MSEIRPAGHLPATRSLPNRSERNYFNIKREQFNFHTVVVLFCFLFELISHFNIIKTRKHSRRMRTTSFNGNLYGGGVEGCLPKGAGICPEEVSA